MPHLTLALARPSSPVHFRTPSEIKRNHLETHRTIWRKHRTFSLLAQLLSPLAPLFSLPALTEHWYVQHDATGAIVQTKDDPPLIIAVGAVVLAISLFANLSILLRLLDVHCRLFTLTTLSLLSLHIVLAIVTCAIFGIQHAHPDGYVLSTAFWLTVVAAAVAFAVVVSLVLDGIKTKWYVDGGTGLTGEQRSLVIVFDLFIACLMVGSIAFRYLLDQATYLDATYFTIQCMITTGFGDVAPTSVGARVFFLIFMVGGILNFAILVAFVRSTALEAIKNRYMNREKEALRRLKTRHQQAFENHSKFTAILVLATCGLYHPPHKGRGLGSDGTGTTTSISPVETAGTDATAGRDSALDKDGALTKEKGTEEEEDPDRPNRNGRKSTKYAYEEKVEQLERERSREFRSQLISTLVLVLAVWLLGAVAFAFIEGWSYWTAYYFCFVAISTIGLGDITPVTPAGRAFFCAWSLMGAGILTVFFSILADGYSDQFKETFQRNVLASSTKAFSRKHPHKAKKLEQLTPSLPQPHGRRRRRAGVETSSVDRPRDAETDRASSSSDSTTETGHDRGSRDGRGLQEEERDVANEKIGDRKAEIEMLEREQDEDDENAAEHVRHEAEEEEGKGIKHERRNRLLALIGDAKDHLDHLVTNDRANNHAIDAEVRKVMDEENFERKNRERVESDQGLKEFIYLRSLQDKFLEVEALVNLVLSSIEADSRTNDDGKTDGVEERSIDGSPEPPSSRRRASSSSHARRRTISISTSSHPRDAARPNVGERDRKISSSSSTGRTVISTETGQGRIVFVDDEEEEEQGEDEDEQRQEDAEAQSRRRDERP
ncbi:hypothetical protein JCM10212_003705 [Sporobolomyces blumeae]